MAALQHISGVKDRKKYIVTLRGGVLWSSTYRVFWWTPGNLIQCLQLHFHHLEIFYLLPLQALPSLLNAAGVPGPDAGKKGHQEYSYTSF